MCVVGVQPTYLIFQPHWYLSVTKPSHSAPKCMVFIIGISSLDHAHSKLSSEQLVNLLLRYRTNICAIVYCRRNGTEDKRKV